MPGTFPSLPPAFDQSGVQVVIGDGAIATGTIFLVTVKYDLGDEHREIETIAKANNGWAVAFVALSKHDEDYKVVSVAATPYYRSGPEMLADSPQ
jgi:hypothetical protein